MPVAGNEVTVTTLIARARDYADMTGSDFPDDTRMLDYANAALQELHMVLVNSGNEYYRSEASIAVVAGTEAYDLPADFYRCNKVFIDESGYRFKVKKWNTDQVDGLRIAPVSSGTIKIWYTPMMPVITAAGDKMNAKVPWLPTGWEDFIACRMASNLLAREESDYRYWHQRAEQYKQEFIGYSRDRDVGDPDDIGDYYNRWDSSRYVTAAENKTYLYRIIGDHIHVLESDERAY